MLSRHGAQDTESNLRRFAQALCTALPALREQGHPKWREVDLALPPLGRGWVYSTPTSRALRACRGTAAAPASPRRPPSPARRCSREATLLGLCR